jgi:hypothetical protein
MAALQAGPLRLDRDELAALGHRGFVITNRKRFRSFADGWLAIYKADLPLYVSADALLHVVHRAYDRMLQDLETEVLIPRLQALLTGMRARLAGAEGASLAPAARADADFFTAVAQSLLEGRHVAPVAGADAGAVADWTDRAAAAGGMSTMPLRGATRDVDFSLMKPRGHYALDPALRRYFQAVSFLGQVDARFAVPEPQTHRLELRRRELDVAVGLRALMGDAELSAWKQLEATMNAFVGERDAMGPPDVDRLLADLGVKAGGLARVADDKVLATIVSGSYGAQRIAGHPLHDSPDGRTPLPRSFSFTGQRYVVDSHVLSDVVHDRVANRLMPSPLDVAYAVLHDDAAKTLLQPELDAYHYLPELDGARARVESGGEAFWETSLYNLWLGAARALTPSSAAHLDATLRSEAWGRRLLSTELASWAELRHDTILYAKQSYSASIGCSFPDVYVDPYPAFYDRLGKLAAKGRTLLGALDFGQRKDLRTRMDAFFGELGAVASKLGAIAAKQERGARPSADELSFVNGALAEDPPVGGGCGPPPRIVHGWYVRLFYGGPDEALAFRPTVADVHTQPTDAAGNPVGRVLHVATGWPRTMVVKVDVGRGPSPFVGVVSTYDEVITEGFQRYTDEEWRRAIASDNREDVPWMRDLVVR